MQEYAHEFAEHWFHTPTPLEKAGGIWLIKAGRNEAKPNYKIGPRMIVYYSFHFVLEGQVLFTQNQTRITLEQGDVFCLLPHVMHQYEAVSSGRNLRMAWLAFDGKQAASVINHLDIHPERPYMKQVIDPALLAVLDGILQEFSRGSTGHLRKLGMLYELFHQLSEAARPRPDAPRPSASWVSQSVEYFDIHYSEDISVKDVARHFKINRSHFTKTFTEQVGVSPKQYLQNLKMKRAKQLLLETPLTITEIALSLGFPDLYSFTRAFRNYCNISPTMLRKESKKRN